MIPHWLRIVFGWTMMIVIVSPAIWASVVCCLRSIQNKRLRSDVAKERERLIKNTPVELRTPFGTELLSDEEREEAIIPEHGMKSWLGERKLSTLRSSEAEILAGALSSKAFDRNMWAVGFGFVAVLVTPWSSKEVVAALLHPSTEGNTFWAYVAVICQLSAFFVPFMLKDSADGLKARAERCWKRAEAAKKSELMEDPVAN